MLSKTMKRYDLFALFFFYLCPVLGADYVAVNTDKGTFFGEYIESYEDRWFYEAATSHTPKYVLLFYKEKFTLINHKEIESLEILNKAPSRYKKFLKKENLFFKNHLVERASVLTGNEGHHKYERMYGNFAWDIGILDEQGHQYQNKGELLEDYYIFSKKVHSPLPGTVIGKVDGKRDNPPDLTMSSSISGLINNYLTIQVHPLFYLSVVHFKKGSVAVEIGDKIAVGDYLGRVGNSGVSYLPHLHYTLYTYIPEIQRFISVPGYFEPPKGQ